MSLFMREQWVGHEPCTTGGIQRLSVLSEVCLQCLGTTKKPSFGMLLGNSTWRKKHPLHFIPCLCLLSSRQKTDSVRESVRRSVDNLKYHLPSALFETRLLFATMYTRLAGPWPSGKSLLSASLAVGSWIAEPAVVSAFASYRNMDCRACSHIHLYMGSEDSNSAFLFAQKCFTHRAIS